MKLRPEHNDLPVWAKLGKKLRKAARKDDGAVAVMAAGILVFALAIGTVSVDAGMMMWTQRSLQNKADAAAMAASLDINRAQAIVLASMVDNGLKPGNLMSVEDGIWDPSQPVATRFTPTASNGNAVRITIRDEAPVFFMQYFQDGDNVTLEAQSIAANVPEGGFSAGTGLASLNGGLLNNLLSELVGTSLTLDLVSYQGLLQTDIDALTFLDFLATEIGVTAGTYDDLLDTNVTAGDIAAAMVGVLNNEGSLDGNGTAALAALQTLAAEVALTGVTLNLRELLDLGTLAERGIGDDERDTDFDAGVAAFHLLFQSLYAGRAGAIIDLGLALTVPGIADIDVEIAFGEPQQFPGNEPQGRIVVGPVGSRVHTAPMRIRLDVEMLQLLNTVLGLLQVNVPLYLEVAGGDAQLTQVVCGAEPGFDTIMTLQAESGAAQVYIGEVSDAEMSNFSNPVTVDEATLVRVLGLVRVDAESELQILGSGVQNVGFTLADIENRTIKTIGNENALGSTFSSLTDDMTLDVWILGLLGLPVTVVTDPLITLLNSTTPVLDPVIDGLLTTLGVRAGYMDLTGLGVRCGAPTLVG